MNNRPSPASFPQPALARWRAAAMRVEAGALLGNARSLGVIVPHADDETLGCGGLIAAAAARDLAVTVTVLTDGAASHPGSQRWPPARLAAVRETEAAAAVALLSAGRGTVAFARAPDGDLAGHLHVADGIAAAELYVTCWRDDPHPDHVAAFGLACAVAEARRVPLLAFPLWTLTTDLPVPRLPVLRFALGPLLRRKVAALAVHRSQLGELVDDVRGFVLDDQLRRLFLRRDELFVRVR
jgi:LmbE family N-acetylglucosaminyl deacetylase